MPRWIASTRRKRKRWVYSCCLAVVCILAFTFYLRNDQTRLAKDDKDPPPIVREHNPLLYDHANFWRNLFELILNHDPQCEKKPDAVVPWKMDISYDSDHEHPRPDILWIDSPDLERLKAAHANFIKDIPRVSSSLAFIPGTRGVVTTASEPLLTVLAISIRMLRKTQSTLPVEIFLNKPTPYTDAFCSTVFPPLHAKCLYLSDIFSTAETGVDLNSYQFKVFAILFSTFENVLLLDSDAWPITNPDPLFDALPFTDTGMVLWPDFWYPTESPYYFSIAKIHPIPEPTARAATESGEMLYSKSKHAESLMLATYYNYHGPSYYYILQSQGAPGQGDKETFPWSATALNKPFYFVSHPVETLGRHDSLDGYIGSAMLQYDPVTDFFNTHRQSQQSHSTPNTPPKPLFVHANFPKFNPFTIFDDTTHGRKGPTRDSNGTQVRCWMPKGEAIERFGFDLEGRFWEAIEEESCGPGMGLWVGGRDAGREERELVWRRDREVCERVRMYRRFVFGNKEEES